MAVEYEGKYYEVVTDNSGLTGDLIHLTEEYGLSCDVWRFTSDTHVSVPDISEPTLGGRLILDNAYDKFTRYREVQAPVEKAETLPNPYETGRYKVASIDGSTELYVNSVGDDYVMLTKNIAVSADLKAVSSAQQQAETVNTYGIGTFAAYKEVASLVRLEDDNA